MILYLLSVGFVSILAQVVILRELNVAFFGVELVYIVAISVWLLSTAAGALLRQRSTATRARVGGLFVAFSFLLLAEIVVVRSLRTAAGAIPGTFLPFGIQIVGLAAAVAPVGVVLGVLFRGAAALYVSSTRTRTLARAYAIESAGGLVGGLLSTLFLAVGLQNFTVAVACGGAALLTVLLAGRHDRGANRTRSAALAGLVLFAVIGAASPRIDRALTRLSHPSLVASRDSPYGRVTVTSRGGQSVVYENDAMAFETQNVSAAEEIVHLAAVNAARVENVLFLGGGLEGTAAEVAKYGPRRVDIVELNPVLVALCERHLPNDYRAALTRDGAALHIEDPRAFVARAEEKYDLVVIGAADPSSGQTNRFFTREFFAACREVLSPGGVIALRLLSAENVWTPFLSYRNTSIVKALKEAYDDVVALPGTSNIVIASRRPLSRDPAVLGARLRESGVATKLVTAAYIEYLYTNDRFGEIERRVSETSVAPNTDTRPVCYRYSSLIWLSKFFPQLITADIGSPELTSGRGAVFVVSAAALAGAVIVLLRARRRFRRVALVALAWFVGMILETAIILHYQVENGVLYQNLGVLLTAFMAGLAAGAEATFRAARSESRNSMSPNRMHGLLLAGGFPIISVVLVGFLRAGGATELWAASLLLAACGFLVAGIFAYASLAVGGEQDAMIGPLYAADLLGGCAGSLLCCVFLIPFAGMEQTAGVAFVLSLVALLAV